MINVTLTSALGLCLVCGLVAGCSAPDPTNFPSSQYTDGPARFTPYYVGPSEGWGGRTVSLHAPSGGGSG